MTTQQEHEVIRQVIAGNTSRYRLLVNKYQHYAFTIAFNIVGNLHDAEDVCQDAFVKAYKSLEKFKFESKFSTWLYRIVVNTAISKRRKQKYFEETNEQLGGEIHNQNQLHKKLQKEVIQTAFSKMKEEDVVVLTLFYLKELRIAEIANILNQTENNVKVKLYRARKRLAELLQKEFKHEVNFLL